MDRLQLALDAENVESLPSRIDAVNVYWDEFSKINEDYMVRLGRVGTPEQYQGENQRKCYLLQRKLDLERKCKDLVEVDDDSGAAGADYHYNSHNWEKSRKHLPKLANNVKEWLPFWAHFQEVDSNAKMSEVRKLRELLKSTAEGSEAREIVESYGEAGKNYSAALDYLRNMYGRPNVLIKVYVRELLQTALDKSLGKAPEFRKLVTSVTATIRNLDMLGLTADKSAMVLYPIVELCLPQQVLVAWQHDPLHDDDLGKLMKFLQEEVVHETERKYAQFQLSTDKTKGSGNDKKVKAVSSTPTAISFHSQDSASKCVFCDRPHPAKDCRDAWKMTYEDREQLIKKKGACFACLEIGHRSTACPTKSNLKCKNCGKPHYKLMCRRPQQQSGSAPNSGGNQQQSGSRSLVPVSEAAPTPSAPPASTIGMHCGSELMEVPLQVIPIKITGPTGKSRVVRALLDTGSQKSYMTATLKDELEFVKIGEKELTHQLFGGVTSPKQLYDIVKVHASGSDDSHPRTFDVFCLRRISEQVYPPSSGPWLAEFQERGVTFPPPGSSTRIDILIGNDVVPRLYTGRIVDLETGPVAMETRYGWVLCGKLPSPPNSRSGSLMVITSMMNQPLSSLWDLDTLGIRDETERQSKEEMAAETQQHFNQTVTRQEDGRYQVCLPFVTGSQQLIPSNYYGAERRLRMLTEKLRQQGLLESYSKLFNQWETDMMIEEVPLEKDIGHFLPHRAVVKMSSSTTPIRPVFDASAKVKGKPSLNDCLEKGPNLLELIPSLLTRFRLEKVGITADIKKAFQQISISPEHRKFVKFLWWNDEDCSQLKVYQHTRVVFGVTSSPFLLGATLNHHLNETPEPLRETAQRLMESLYVDNVVDSLPSMELAHTFQKQSQELLEPAHFDLRGWEMGPVTGEGKSISILGIVWNTSSDKLSFELKPVLDLIGKGTTPRAVLSVAHMLYDPLGFISPFIIVGKMLLSRVHEEKTGWDTRLSPELQSDFDRWSKQIPSLSEFEMDRFCFWSAGPNRSLHVFSDASAEAYAAVVFLRVETRDGVRISLLQAKARVAPQKKNTKKMTIPRLELLGCLVGTRLAKTVMIDLKNPPIPVTFWTDSSTALAWVTGDGPWQTFVQNRVLEIRNSTAISQWRHVPGKLNPADLPSRGCSAAKLIESQWWEGPQWLYLPETEWPRTVGEPNEEDVLLEKRKTVTTTTVAVSADPICENFLRISDYPRILHAVARWNRVKINLRHRVDRRRNGNPTPVPVPIQISEDEHQSAEGIVIRHVQRRLPDEPNRIMKLRPFMDGNGLWRTRTRLLQQEEIDIAPIILPDNDQFVRRLIYNLHSSTCHVGTQLLLSKIRERFWLLNGRREARKVVRACWTCRRYNSKRLDADEPPLPIARTGAGAPFNVVGVDMAGPLILRNKKKVWVALFTCASYRAIHLDVVDSMSTDEFLVAFRRFVARRGKPTIVYSDNGLNFVGANAALLKVYKRDVTSFACENRIEWRFNPPSAAWTGGFYERLIGMMKQLLRRILGNKSVNQKELEVLLLEVEEALNNRPLTYLPEDPDDPIPLTPNMLVRNSGLAYFPELDIRDGGSARAAHKRVQALRSALRSRFRKEYLGQLKFERKARKSNVTLKPGDVVLVETDNQKRQGWPLGVVVGREKGAFLIKTKNGILKRAVQRLFPMELAEEEE